MKIEAIDKRFTEVVNAYLSMGMVINAQTMSSSSCGEIAKVDMTDGKSIYRIGLYEDCTTVDDSESDFIGDSINFLCIRVLRMDGEEAFSRLPFGFSANGNQETVYEEMFYEIVNRTTSSNRRKNKVWYVTNLEEYKDAVARRYSRRKARRIYAKTVELPRAYRYIALSWAKKHIRGCKSAKIDDVTGFSKVFTYSGNTVIYAIDIKGHLHTMWERSKHTR